MKDICCRHGRLLSQGCAKCIKYIDNRRLKRSLLNEVIECIRGNDSSNCEKCAMQENIIIIYIDNDNILLSDSLLCCHGCRKGTCEKCSRKKNNFCVMQENDLIDNDNIMVSYSLLCGHGCEKGTCAKCSRK